MEHLLAQELHIPSGTGSTPETLIQGIIPQNAAWVPKTIGDVVNRMIPYVFAAAGFGLLIMIVMAGFSILTSAGDVKKMEMGKHQLTNAIIGFVIIFLAYWLTQIAGVILGIKEIPDIFK
jgi:hypothetical protein